VFLADLRDEVRTDEINWIVESIKDSQREVEVLAARDGEIVVCCAHVTYFIF
jgi:hypothetical protein